MPCPTPRKYLYKLISLQTNTYGIAFLEFILKPISAFAEAAQTICVKMAVSSLEICLIGGKIAKRKTQELKTKGPRYTLWRQM